MLKHFRQEQILKLIRTQQIFTQEELSEKLRKLGIRATQVTLSRDLHELGLAKTAEGYKELVAPVPSPAAPRDGSQLRRIAGAVLRDVRQAQNLLVLKTDPGNAQPLALALDHENWPEVVGTIAGDDTIMVVTSDNKTAMAARAKLLDLIRK